MLKYLRTLLIGLTTLVFLCSLPGCNSDSGQTDITGYWTGRSENFSTHKSWDIKMFFFQEGNQIAGVYTDYRGSISLTDTVYVGTEISFTLPFESGVVTFTGDLNTENRFDGNWTYPENGNEGIWLLLRDDDDFSEGNSTPPPDSQDTNPFL